MKRIKQIALFGLISLLGMKLFLILVDKLNIDLSDIDLSGD